MRRAAVILGSIEVGILPFALTWRASGQGGCAADRNGSGGGRAGSEEAKEKQ